MFVYMEKIAFVALSEQWWLVRHLGAHRVERTRKRALFLDRERIGRNNTGNLGAVNQVSGHRYIPLG